MLAMAFRSMGLDPGEIIRQAANMGAVFEAMARGQEEMARKLDAIERQQTAIMASMGLYVPVPEGETKALIEAGSKAWIDAHGGYAVGQ